MTTLATPGQAQAATMNTKALTVRQPWAAAIAHHGKTVENRSWHTNWRGTLLIHAAKTAHPGISLIEHSGVRSAIVAVATLTDCHPGDGPCTSWADHPEPAAWHWVLEDVHALAEPVPCKGALGLWTPSPEVAASAFAALDAPEQWLPMSEAPRDGTAIVGLVYGDPVAIRWAEDRVCMLADSAPGAGLFGPGWEDVENGLYVGEDDGAGIDGWRPVEGGAR